MRLMARLLLVPLCVLLLPACSGDIVEGTGTEGGTDTDSDTDSGGTDAASDTDTTTTSPTTDGTGTSTGSDSNSSGSGSSGVSASATDSSSGGSGTTTDATTTGGTGTTGTTGTTGSSACKKVDVVFAVDNSMTMVDEIAALRGPAWVGLADDILAVGDGLDDFQLGVINGCPKPGFLFDTGMSGACNFSTGANYMSSGSANLDTEYNCVMELTDSGYMGLPDQCVDANQLLDDNEQPAQAASRVVSEPNASNQNAGFLRSDAILFVLAMTDEDEELIDGNANPLQPMQIAQTLIDAKGDVKDVVFLGIGGDSNCNGPYGQALAAPQLKAVTKVFGDQGRGVFWDLCQGDIPAAVDQALTVLDTACLEHGL